MIKISIPEEIVTKLERYYYAYKSRQEIIENILTNNYDISVEQFQLYQDEYDKYYYNFMKEKDKFEQTYVLTKIGANEKKDWKLDYNTCILTIF